MEPVVRDHGLAGFEELARRLRGPGGTALHDAVVEAITTGETAFFRDGRARALAAAAATPIRRTS